MVSAANGVQQTYDRLWQEAVAAFDAGRPGIDPHLSDQANDLRRGVTLALRPGRKVQRSVAAFLAELTGTMPGQYFYQPEELHVTVLAIIPGTEFWREKLRQLPAYEFIIGKILREQPRFSVVFQGVTASAGAVMIQGFPADDTLTQIRDHLREALRQEGLGDELDRRYRINTAHMTLMRFRQPEADWNRLRTFLEAHRTTPFGETRVKDLQLVLGDWYASAASVHLLEEYRLGI